MASSRLLAWLSDRAGRPQMTAEERALYLETHRDAAIDRLERAIPIGAAIALVVPLAGSFWAPAGARWRVWLAAVVLSGGLFATRSLLRRPSIRIRWQWFVTVLGLLGGVACGVVAAYSGGFVSPAAGGLLLMWGFGAQLAPSNLLLNFFQVTSETILCTALIAGLAPEPGSPTFFLVLNGAGLIVFQVGVTIRERQALHAFLTRRRLDEANAALAQLNAELERRVQERVIERSRELAAALARLGKKDQPKAADVGSVLNGRIEIVRAIDSGGMGDVFEGIDHATRSRVAVKVIRAHDAREIGDLQRFLTEARAAAAVAHPGIVRTYDVDVTPEGTVFQVMELVSGLTLEAWIARPAPRSVGAVAVVGRVLAEALAAAHDAGVVHRDVKPSNVMLTREAPGLKVLDFGISKVTTDSGHLRVTQSHVGMGTPAYMAPEQFHSSKLAGPAADVYAMGVVLYEVVTGKLPFQGTAARLLLAHAEEPPDESGLRSRELPGALASAILRCLAKEPTERPAAADVARIFAVHAVDSELAKVVASGMHPRHRQDAPTEKAV
jgi:tRNA A-37 threonylcarbamoyl transferase component Bud32